SAPRASLGASSRSPARPCRPRGGLHTAGAWLLIVRLARRLEAQPGPAAAHRNRGLPARLLSMPRTLLGTSA
ncbi:hypothetical protein, partial [Actinomyces sp. ICM47]|uniref:hypothetical protein n=1 Tax=Actinomyces sp. ICM47 TaxID=936548 RepID=UPI001E4E110F